MNKHDNPTVDVIIPSYNCGQWLRDTINTVLNQTYSNLLVYVVDDGSTDNTSDVMRSIKDKRVIYIRKKNGGVSSARNLGIRRSKSSYIAFLDADDLWHSDKLEKQMNIMQSDDSIGLVYGGHYSINSRGIIVRSLMGACRGYIFEDLCKGNIISGSASMVLTKRSVINEVGLFSEELINGCEDWEMWLRIARKYPIDYVDDVIADLRVLETSMQSNGLKMAKNSVLLFQIVTRDLELSRHERVLLACTCYTDAIRPNYDAKLFRQSRRYAWLLLKENPRFIFDLNTWKISIVPSFFMKTLFGNIGFNFIGRLFRKIGWIIDEILSLTYTLLARAFNLFKYDSK